MLNAGAVPDILTCPSDNINLCIFLLLNKQIFGKVYANYLPETRDTERATVMNGFVGAGGLPL